MGTSRQEGIGDAKVSRESVNLLSLVRPLLGCGSPHWGEPMPELAPVSIVIILTLRTNQMSKISHDYGIRRSLYITPPLGSFPSLIARQLKKKVPIPNDTPSEGSQRHVSNRRPFLATTLFRLLWTYRAWKIGPRERDIQRPSYTVPGIGHTKQQGLLLLRKGMCSKYKQHKEACTTRAQHNTCYIASLREG